MRKMGEKLLNSLDEISVVDVYDLASDIGKECEKIIEIFGAEAVTSLMPKVINALELLEGLASRNENENETIQMLTDRIAYLENEMQEKAVFRERLQKELETTEEQWHTETSELEVLVNRLQEENRRISKQQESPKRDGHDKATAKDDQSTKAGDSTNLLNASDFQKLQRLRGQMEKQRDELKCRDQEVYEKNTEIENLLIQMERLKSSGRESRKRQKVLQTHVRSLLEERADFLVQIQEQNREITTLRKRLGTSDNENSDVSKSRSPDGNKARFSTNELKELLVEKDNLKAKIVELETELKQFKPVVPDAVTHEDERYEEDDPPVQGPLPYEPDDAPWKKSSETGVRKFFRKLFSEPSSSSFPRRSFSTLSKMALSGSPSRGSAM